MVDDRLPLIRGRIISADTYEAPQRGGTPPAIPSLDPKTHRARLIAQMNAIERQVQARAETARDELATREIVAVLPSTGSTLTPEQLDDTRTDARLVGVVPETGAVLLDIANPHLDHLRKKRRPTELGAGWKVSPSRVRAQAVRHTAIRLPVTRAPAVSKSAKRKPPLSGGSSICTRAAFRPGRSPRA